MNQAFDETTRSHLIAFLRLPEQVSVAAAAEFMGSTEWASELMHLVAIGELASWTHSPRLESLPQSRRTFHATGEEELLPRLDEREADPATVTVEKSDVLWLWCHREQELAQGIELPPQDDVEALEARVYALVRSIPPRPHPPGAEPPPRHVKRQPTQEEAILSKLAELGFDPTALPVPPPGKASQAKRAVRTALGYTKDVMEKAWKRLRAEGRLKDA